MSRLALAASLLLDANARPTVQIPPPSVLTDGPATALPCSNCAPGGCEAACTRFWGPGRGHCYTAGAKCLIDTPEAADGSCCDCPGALCPSEEVAVAPEHSAAPKAGVPGETGGLEGSIDPAGNVSTSDAPEEKEDTAATVEPDTTVFFNVFRPQEASAVAQGIVSEQLRMLRASPGWPRVSSVEYVTIGDPSRIECDRCNHTAHHDEADEVVTLDKLHAYCKAAVPPDGSSSDLFVAYVHDKGSFHASAKNDWLRRMLMHAVSSCISDQDEHGHTSRLRNNECDVCSARFSPVPHFHTPGNMWVARCDYVAKLIGPQSFADAMERVHPGGSAEWSESCFGLGRYAQEHWVHSHPKVRPCDVYPGEYKWQYHQVPTDESWKSDVAMAPRYEFESYAPRVLTRGCAAGGWVGGGDGGRERRLAELRREWNILYPDRCEADWIEPYFARGQVKDLRQPTSIDAPWEWLLSRSATPFTLAAGQSSGQFSD